MVAVPVPSTLVAVFAMPHEVPPDSDTNEPVVPLTVVFVVVVVTHFADHDEPMPVVVGVNQLPPPEPVAVKVPSLKSCNVPLRMPVESDVLVTEAAEPVSVPRPPAPMSV